jgi:hypothetical protein
METLMKNSAFNFNQVCEDHNLNPETTSLHEAECIYLGLDPETTSIHARECKSRGLDPDKTSPEELKRHTGF